MARWLVVCIDGTWNSSAEQTKCFCAPTNVQRISELLVNDETQRVFYLPGIGTGSATDRFVGGVWGTGTTRRIHDGYRILCENWQPDDAIALIGFSRGAFAVRWITGIMANVGLLRREHLELINRAITIGTRPTRGLLRGIENLQKDKFVRNYCHPRDELAVGFVGVFDTVIRYGPLFELGRRTIQVVRRRHIGLRDNRAPPFIRYIAHALALDESRAAFAPWRYKEDPELVRWNRIEEVWFAGSHSDVGGGYVDSRSSESALRWMIDRAVRRGGLRFKEMPVMGEGAHCAPLHQSRTGMWRYLPSAPRIVNEGDRVHSSVELRIQATDYRPTATLPAVLKMDTD